MGRRRRQVRPRADVGVRFDRERTCSASRLRAGCYPAANRRRATSNGPRRTASERRRRRCGGETRSLHSRHRSRPGGSCRVDHGMASMSSSGSPHSLYRMSMCRARLACHRSCSGLRIQFVISSRLGLVGGWTARCSHRSRLSFETQRAPGHYNEVPRTAESALARAVSNRADVAPDAQAKALRGGDGAGPSREDVVRRIPRPTDDVSEWCLHARDDPLPPPSPPALRDRDGCENGPGDGRSACHALGDVRGQQTGDHGRRGGCTVLHWGHRTH